MGNDVFIRPAGDHGLVLVAGLSRDAVERMAHDGWAPAATIEASPGRYQAWVKVSDKPLPEAVQRIVSLDLAKRYGGDVNSATGQLPGHLAGFTNRAPQYTRDGLQPYVLAHECPGKVAKAASEYLQRFRQELAREVQRTRDHPRDLTRDRGRGGPDRG